MYFLTLKERKNPIKYFLGSKGKKVYSQVQLIKNMENMRDSDIIDTIFIVHQHKSKRSCYK